MDAVLAIYAEGLATRNATFETKVPTADADAARWLPDLAWVAELDGRGRRLDRHHARCRRASATPASGESSVYVTEAARGRGVGKALLFTQVTEADRAGMWTLQTSIFPENRASLALHRSAGYRTLAVRTRIAQLDGVWRDTVLLERRARSTSADPRRLSPPTCDQRWVSRDVLVGDTRVRPTRMSLDTQRWRAPLSHQQCTASPLWGVLTPLWTDAGIVSARPSMLGG